MPENLITDQGRQLTPASLTGALRQHETRISMDGPDRWLEYAFVERLWRSVKYDQIYLGDVADRQEL